MTLHRCIKVLVVTKIGVNLLANKELLMCEHETLFFAIYAGVEWTSQQLPPSVGPLHFQIHYSPNHCMETTIVETSNGYNHRECLQKVM